MSIKKQKNPLTIMNPNAAGIDIGSRSHYVAVPEGRDTQTVRKFGCFTIDIYLMAKWLDECNVDTIAMESTGVYWIPVFQILEQRGFKVILVNARHIKNVPGRKSDVQDCQWIQQLHSFGLLNGSFRPKDEICVLRSYIRQRDTLIKSSTSIINRMQKSLTQMNIQFHRVISDITGTTGTRIIEAILNGERNSLVLAKMKDPRIRSDLNTLAKSLEGDYREEHIFTLKQEYELYKVHRQKILECDTEIERCLHDFDSKVDPAKSPLPKPKTCSSKRRNGPSFDLRTHLYRITGVDLTRINGVDVNTAQAIVSEVGINMEKWRSEKHFTSWLGLSPNNKITGDKIKGTKTKKVVNRAAVAFRLAAQSLTNSKSALGAYYRRMRTRLGGPKAITATARKLACIFYQMLRYGKDFVDSGLDYYEKKYQQKVLNNIKRRAKQLGYQVVKLEGVTKLVT